MTVFGMSLYYSRDVIIRMVDGSEFRNAILGSVLMLLVSCHLMNLLSECDLIIRIAAVIVVCSGVYTLVLLAFKDKVLRNVISQVKKKLHKKED